LTSFRTEFKEWASPFKLNHAAQIFCLGSCFAHELYKVLNTLQFRTTFSPFGITFNPLSLFEQMDRIIDGRAVQAEDLIFHDSIWHSMIHHGSYSSPDQDVALKKMNQELLSTQSILMKSNFIVMTWGSAHYYRFKDSGQVVANCHKIPQANFEKDRCSIEEITQSFEKLWAKLCHFNPNLKIILSISPVRYLKDGFSENSRSKAILLESAWRICEKMDSVHYFPSYEIFMDDLRDYRFCKTDLVHPSEEAIHYIMDQFGKSFFSQETHLVNQKIRQILTKSSHRPLHPESKSHRDFLAKLETEKKELKREFPDIEFRWDENQFIS
jgi:hypothetical protein